MRVVVIAVANRQPSWVDQGFDEYAKRLGKDCRLELKQIALAKHRSRGNLERVLEDEGHRMLAAVPKAAHVVALSESGSTWSTKQLAARLRDWMTLGAPVSLLIGGPDGLSATCTQRAAERWSLSPLTLPHGLARILVAEAVYRAWTVNQRHPYHRS